MKKRIFPGTETLAERKRFAIFHACTLIIAPLIAALIIFLMNWRESVRLSEIGFIVPLSIQHVSLNPFKDVGDLLLWSLCIWNLIGSLRFHDDAFDEGGRLGGFIARGVSLLFMLIFPFYYLYNLWCVFRNKE